MRNEGSCNFLQPQINSNSVILRDPKVLTMLHLDSSHPVPRSCAALLQTRTAAAFHIWAGSVPGIGDLTSTSSLSS